MTKLNLISFDEFMKIAMSGRHASDHLYGLRPVPDELLLKLVSIVDMRTVPDDRD